MVATWVGAGARMSRGRRGCPFAAAFVLEPIEKRLLLTLPPGVMDLTSSSVATLATPSIAWNSSGVVPGMIAKGTYTSTGGVGGGDCQVEAYTQGTDPGWYSIVFDASQAMSARSEIDATVVGGGLAQGMGYAVLDYGISVRLIQPLPEAFPTSSFTVPISATFEAFVQLAASEPGPNAFIDGHANASFEYSVSGVYGQRFDAEIAYNPAMQDDLGIQEQQLVESLNHDLSYDPATNTPGYVTYTLTAAGSTTVAVGAGSISSTAMVFPLHVTFDQARFVQLYGDQAFPLENYFELVLGIPNPTTPPKKKGKNGNNLQYSCTVPDLVAASDTGNSNSDDVTGDLTPTFTGSVASGIKPMKSGLVVVYVDGQEAGRGTVSNGVYRVTVEEPMIFGLHTITVAAGIDDLRLGPRSSGKLINIDTDLPRGDSASVTLGDDVKSVTFVDGDGTKATVKLTAGQATMAFSGDDLQAIPGKGGITVSGIGVRLLDVDLSGDTANAKLTLTAKGGDDGVIHLDNIRSQGAIQSILGKTVNLDGDLLIDGRLTTLTLKDIRASQQQTLSWTGAADDAPTTVKLGNVGDVSLHAGNGIKLLQVISWLDDNEEADVIAAAWLGSHKTSGPFEAIFELDQE